MSLERRQEISLGLPLSAAAKYHRLDSSIDIEFPVAS